MANPFMDAVTLNGRRAETGVGRTTRWIARNGRTEGTTTRFRSGSVTDTHTHGPGIPGTARHTDRAGNVTTVRAVNMDARSRAFALNRR